MQATSALLRWAVAQGQLPATQWEPPTDLPPGGGPHPGVGSGSARPAVATGLPAGGRLWIAPRGAPAPAPTPPLEQAPAGVRSRRAHVICDLPPKVVARRWATAFRPTWLPTAAGEGMTWWMTPSPRQSLMPMTGRAERAIFGAASWRMVRPTPQHHPTDRKFRAHEASASMALLTPNQTPAGQGTPEASAQETRLTSENLAWVDEKIKEPG